MSDNFVVRQQEEDADETQAWENAKEAPQHQGYEDSADTDEQAYEGRDETQEWENAKDAPDDQT
jgi:hypothetical protein